VKIRLDYLLIARVMNHIPILRHWDKEDGLCHVRVAISAINVRSIVKVAYAKGPGPAGLNFNMYSIIINFIRHSVTAKKN